MYISFLHVQGSGLRILNLWGYQNEEYTQTKNRYLLGFFSQGQSTVQNQFIIPKGFKTRRQCQVVVLGWMEKEGSPWELDRGGLNVVQWKIKPGRLTSAVPTALISFLQLQGMVS